MVEETEEEAAVERQPVVWYIRTRCPRCGTPNPHVTQRRGIVRNHCCQACGHTFKSIETTAADLQGRAL